MARLIHGRWVLRRMFKKRGGVWHVRVHDTRTGRLREFSTMQTRQDRAEQAALDRIHEWSRSEEDEIRPARFDMGYEEFLSLKAVRNVTLINYEITFRGVYGPAFRDRLVHEIEFADVQRFLHRARVDRGVADRTIIKYLTQLRAFFSWARLRGHCLKNPTDGLKVRRPPKHEPRVLTVDEARGLLAVCREPMVLTVRDARRPRGWRQSWTPPPSLYVAVLVALHTGLRRGNVVGLYWRHVDLGRRRLTLRAEETKAGADLVLPIHSELAEVLAGLLREVGHLAPDNPILRVDLKSSFESAVKRAGLHGLTFHGLRHTFAAWLAEHPTCSYVALRQLLGHSPGSVTLRYAQHVSFEKLREIIDTMPRLMPAPVPAATAP